MRARAKPSHAGRYLLPSGGIGTRERRGLQYAMNGEQHDVAQFLPRAIAVTLTREEAAQAFLPDICFDRRGVSLFPRRGQRARRWTVRTLPRSTGGASIPDQSADIRSWP
jgi:hypothetical protein